MCGRFRLPDDDNFNKEIMWIVKKIKHDYPDCPTKFGDIYPTDLAPVLTLQNDEIQPIPIKWGFPDFNSKRVIINARAETVSDKKMFSDSFYNRRCVIPSVYFYEWDKQKNKFICSLQYSKPVYMAGIFSTFGGETRFVIITTNANSSVSPIHHRMPVVLPSQNIKNWIYDTSSAINILKNTPPMLNLVMA